MFSDVSFAYPFVLIFLLAVPALAYWYWKKKEKVTPDVTFSSLQLFGKAPVTLKEKFLFLFDEIQKIENWQEQIKRIYDLYKDICFRVGLRPLTQRRVSDILSEFDMMGLINSSVISKGRQGRTRKIKLLIPNNLMLRVKDILYDSLSLEHLK